LQAPALEKNILFITLSEGFLSQGEELLRMNERKAHAISPHLGKREEAGRAPRFGSLRRGLLFSQITVREENGWMD
jgi:hypothetical protein